MKFLAVFIGLVAVIAADMDAVTGDSMIPIEPSLEKQLSSAKFTLKYGEVQDSSFPVVQRFDPISARLVALLEELRESFETGTETLPPLDPFRLAAFGPLSIRQIGIITGTLNAQDIVVRGLKGFIIENLSFSFVGLTLRFEISVPRIDVDAQYQLNSRVAILVPYNPRGAAKIRIDNGRVSGLAGIGQRPDGFLEVSNFELNLDFGNIVADVDGMIGGGLINATLNRVLNLLGPSFFRIQRERLSGIATERLRDTVNTIIGQYRLADLLG